MNYLGDNYLDERISELGGKAANLHLLKKAGFSVPPGFVLNRPISDLNESISRIGGYPVAVRSSCSLEDMSNASFAGLYETFLDVNGHEELQETILKCFNSVDSERVNDYLKNKGITAKPSTLKMNVLVQKMVNSLISGVLFTLNPVNGREDEFYLEYCTGLGERLVSGHVTPTTCRFSFTNNKVIEEVVNQEKTTLPEQALKKLIEVSRKIQAHYGSPQDIEWAFDENLNLFILQSRPITTFTPRDDVPELTNADFKDGGISARVCTPMMFSLYRNAMERSMGEYFKNINLVPNDDGIQWIYYHYGRVYWNAGAVKEGLKKIPGFNEADFDRDLGIQKDYGAAGPHQTGLTIAGAVSAIPVLIGLYREFRDCEIMVDQYKEQFEFRDRVLKEKLETLSRMGQTEFNIWFKEVMIHQCQTEKNYFRTIYNNSNFQTEFKSLLKKSSTYRIGDELDLMVGLAGVAHLDVQTDLDRLTKVHDLYGPESNSYYQAREEFLKHHYHHGPAELDITVPRWGENKEWVDELVSSNPGRSSINDFSCRQTFERIEKGLGVFSRRKFLAMFDRSRQFLKSREEMRALSTRAYYLIRLGLLEFGRRHLLSCEMLFMLDIEEVRKMLDGGHCPIDLFERKLSYEGVRKFVPPNEFGGSIKWDRSSAYEGKLKGIGCSPGEFTGIARIRLDIHETLSLTKNDILVTTFTDPGWTPVLSRVGAVITEVGGILSHAAVIGREYGIPAVLNLQGATSLIPDGAKIRINGKTGTVEILEEGPH